MAQHVGKVIWFNQVKGFGFISRLNGPDIFVHYSGIVSEGYKKLTEGDPVSFDVELGPSGKPQAINVIRC